MSGFSIIVAVDSKMGIGKGNDLPWRLSRDMQHFKEMTLPCDKPGAKNAVVMGRKTWESLPVKYRPLPGRLNVVLSSQEGYALPDGVILAPGLDQALSQLYARKDVGRIFIIGGGVLFREAIFRQDCENLYLTHVEGDYNCDIFFPNIPSFFACQLTSERYQEGLVSFHFCSYKNTEE